MHEVPPSSQSDWAKGEAGLTVRVKGPAVESGAIAVEQLEALLGAVRKSVERFAQEKSERQRELRPGPRTNVVRAQVSLFFTGFHRGSAVLKMELRSPQLGMTGLPPGAEVIEEWMQGTSALHDSNRPVPEAYNRGVIAAMKELDSLLGREVEEVEFSYEVAGHELHARYDETASHRAATLMRRPSVKNRRTIEGVILEADFRAPNVTFVVRTAEESVACTAGEEDLGVIFEGMMHPARVSGEATIDPRTSALKSLVVDSIELDHSADFLSLPPETLRDFWVGVDLDDLAHRQDAHPISPDEEPSWTPPTDDEWARYLKLKTGSTQPLTEGE